MKYKVKFPIICTVTIEIDDAENEDEALELAYQEYGVTNFCGNGGTDKLIGVYGSNQSIEVDSDEPFEGSVDLKILIEPQS